MESSDEDDKFLYGSDNEDPKVTSQKLKKVEDIKDDQSSKEPDDENIYGSQEKEDIIDSISDDDNMEEDAEEADDDDDDEYNIDFIISLGPDTSRFDSRSKNVMGGQQPAGETISVVPTETTDASTKSQEVGKVSEESKSITGEDGAEKVKRTNIEAGSIDLDKDGLFDGRPITEIDPEVLKEKPWRQPGANLSDYFNFGFNESTWTEYLHRQERLRDEYNPRRILMGLLTLQQQGKLDIKTNFDPNKSSHNAIGNNSNKPNVMNPNINKPPVMNTRPPVMPQGFPGMPMFGGFPPFGMPGMMPMNPQQNRNGNTTNNNNSANQRNQPR